MTGARTDGWTWLTPRRRSRAALVRLAHRGGGPVPPPAPQRQGPAPVAGGAGRVVRSLIVPADTAGEPYKSWEEMRPLRQSEQKLRRANKALARTRQGSAGRAKARAKLARLHWTARMLGGLRSQSPFAARHARRAQCPTLDGPPPSRRSGHVDGRDMGRLLGDGPT